MSKWCAHVLEAESSIETSVPIENYMRFYIPAVRLPQLKEEIPFRWKHCRDFRSVSMKTPHILKILK